MDFNERVVPNITANYLFQESLARYEFVVKKIGNNIKILDAACGTGYGSRVLSRRGEVVGLDNDAEAINFAKARYSKYANFLLGDIENIKQNVGTFDVICCFEAIEHLKHPEKMLRGFRKILSKNGVVFISTPNKAYPNRLVSSESPYHVKEYTYRDFHKTLNKHFSKVDILGENKSKKTISAFRDFLKSQEKRQSFVDKDKFGVRKLVPRGIKEYIWRHLSYLFGNKTQNKLTTYDFRFDKKDVKNSEYFVAVCKK